jgi:hypothetical protein
MSARQKAIGYMNKFLKSVTQIPNTSSERPTTDVPAEYVIEPDPAFELMPFEPLRPPNEEPSLQFAENEPDYSVQSTYVPEQASPDYGVPNEDLVPNEYDTIPAPYYDPGSPGYVPSSPPFQTNNDDPAYNPYSPENGPREVSQEIDLVQQMSNLELKK